MKPDSQILLNNSGQYDSLRQQILRRDGWRCQSCGTMSNLDVHHREFRSHLEPTPRECEKKQDRNYQGGVYGIVSFSFSTTRDTHRFGPLSRTISGEPIIGCDSNTGLSIPNYRKVALAYDLKTAVTGPRFRAPMDRSFPSPWRIYGFSWIGTSSAQNIVEPLSEG